MTRTISRAIAVCLLTGAAAAQSGGVLDGLTVRFLGGLDHMGGIDGLNAGIDGMNTYFGPDGTWAADAQGQDLSGGGWSPVLEMKGLTNRPDLGLAVEKAILRTDYTRLLLGLEWASGATSTSGEFSFTPPASNLNGSIWNEERVSVDNIMLTGRYSLKDPNLPLHGHVGMGVGYGSIDTEARFIGGSTMVSEDDPDLGNWAPYQIIEAAYDGNAVTARVFLGFEYGFGPLSALIDFGYNYMDFGKLDGKTTLQFRDQIGADAGTFDEVPIDPATVPDTRYEFAPLIQASLQENQLRSAADLLGMPYEQAPLDAGNPKAIEYDLSGGYVRFGLAFNF